MTATQAGLDPPAAFVIEAIENDVVDVGHPPTAGEPVEMIGDEGGTQRVGELDAGWTLPHH